MISPPGDNAQTSHLATIAKRFSALALTDRAGMSALTVAIEGNADSMCSP
jgi:hypothetical protein